MSKSEAQPSSQWWVPERDPVGLAVEVADPTDLRQIQEAVAAKLLEALEQAQRAGASHQDLVAEAQGLVEGSVGLEYQDTLEQLAVALVGVDPLATKIQEALEGPQADPKVREDALSLQDQVQFQEIVA